MRTKNILLIFFAFILMNINFGSEPTPPPYHQYIVSGFLICDTLADKSNYTVAVWGKSILLDNEFRQIINTGFGLEHPLALTDSFGKYSLLINSYSFLDTLKIGLIQPEHSTIFSDSYPIDPRNRITDERTYNNDNGSGCSSCTSEVTESSIVIKYQYNLDSTKLFLCR